MKKKSSLIKDALILCLITLISGLLLGAVNHITKQPIKDAEESAKNEAYKKVVPAAESFSDISSDMLSKSEKLLSDSDNVTDTVITACLAGSDKQGSVVGYVVVSTCSKSYGGDISVVTGFDNKGIVTGIEVLSINDTPGLGMKAKEASFREQYVGVDSDYYTVTKTGKTKEGEVDAISSATITSKAFTNAVNGAKVFVSYIIKGGE